MTGGYEGLGLTVDDDGTGLRIDVPDEPHGHFGLRLAHDLADRAGDRPRVGRAPLGGVRVALDLPAA